MNATANGRTQLQQFIYVMCDRVYRQLGPSHSEAVYQKALHYELMSQGIMTEMEKHLDVNYVDSRGNSHNITSDRIDVFIHQDTNSVLPELVSGPIFLELKAVSKQPNEIEFEQVNKYIRELYQKNIRVNYGILVNFPQPTRQNVGNSIDFHIISSNYN